MGWVWSRSVGSEVNLVLVERCCENGGSKLECQQKQHNLFPIDHIWCW